jgi:hypothetical protein
VPTDGGLSRGVGDELLSPGALRVGEVIEHFDPLAFHGVDEVNPHPTVANLAAMDVEEVTPH